MRERESKSSIPKLHYVSGRQHTLLFSPLSLTLTHTLGCMILEFCEAKWKRDRSVLRRGGGGGGVTNVGYMYVK